MKMSKKLQVKHQSTSTDKPKKGLTFFGLREELKQVTWPTRQEAVQLTITVITISLIMGLFVGIIDISLAKVLEIISH